jgi:TolB protein
MTASSRRAKAVFAAGLVVAVCASPTVAPATPPGENGSIVFRRYLGPDRTKGAIFVAAADGTRERQLTRPPAGFSDDYPDFAGDGSFIACQRCGETSCGIYTVRPDGTGLKRIDRGCRGMQVPPKCIDHSYPAISPDGKRLAFHRAFGRISNDGIDHAGIYVMRLDGSHVRRVSLPPTRTAYDDQPQWSPDGKRIVFQRRNASARPRGRRAVFVVNADGTRLRRLTPWRMNAGDGPDWSPDGSRILFRSPDDGSFLNSNLYTIRPDGKDLTRVTNVPPTTTLYSASWSPDGASITLGMMGVEGEADVYTMRADGTGVTPLTRTRQWDSAPDWGGR